ncbi:MAG: glycosyltransferase, partial [Leptolyngbya sp.]|nr:glycosyltransferase [Leptolyngbya sp.]
MKILFIITRSDTIGGAQVHVRDLSKALIKDGHEVLVLVGLAGPYIDDLSLNQIPFRICPALFRSIKPLQDLKTLELINRVVKEFQPDLITTHSSKAGILGRIIAKINHIPCIFTVHGWAFTEGVPQPKRVLYEMIERLIAPLSSRIICVSNYDRDIGIKAGIKSSRLKTIYNGMPDICPSLRAHPGNNDTVNVIMVARFDQQKDHSTLI